MKRPEEKITFNSHCSDHQIYKFTSRPAKVAVFALQVAGLFLALHLLNGCASTTIPSEQIHPDKPVRPMESAAGKHTSLKKMPAKTEPPDALPSGKMICIDPGHQQKGDTETEPIAPGSKHSKAKVTSGATGVSSRTPEYRITLEIGMKLKEILNGRGFRTVMTRETHHINISNRERALLCNETESDLSVRIHADGSSNSKISGVSLLYPAPSSPGIGANKQLILQSERLAQHILDATILKTNATNRGLRARNDLTGFNWSEIPVALIECGFLSHPDEDEKLNDPVYQMQLAEGIAEGIVRYFE